MCCFMIDWNSAVAGVDPSVQANCPAAASMFSFMFGSSMYSVLMDVPTTVKTGL